MNGRVEKARREASTGFAVASGALIELGMCASGMFWLAIGYAAVCAVAAVGVIAYYFGVADGEKP